MLPKKIVMIASMLAMGLVSAQTAKSAMASTVNVISLADAGSLAAHQQGSTFKVISALFAGNWPMPKNFSVNIPDMVELTSDSATDLGGNAVKVVMEPQPHIASWEIAGQFNAAQNPFEVWTYGYTDKADCTGPMIPFKNKLSTSFVGRPFESWVRGTTTNANDLPTVSQSRGITLLSPLKLSPNGLSMHPGSEGQCAVVRFTAPANGRYRFMGRFWAQNVSSSGTDTNVMIAINGNNPPIFFGNIKALGSPTTTTTNMPFMKTGIALAVGNTIDFKVGANGNFLNDSTGLHGYIQRDER